MRDSVAAVLLAAALAAPALAEEVVLATVDGEPVTAADLEEEFTRRHAGHARFLGGPSEIREFLDKVIDRRLLIAEAYRLELDRVPVVAESVAAFAEQKAIERLLAEEITEKAKPTEDEIREAWKTKTTTLTDVRQIVVETADEARAVRAELAAGADFETLARARSKARSRLRGGRLGEVGWGSQALEWEAAVEQLEPGALSEPIAGPEGWEIVQLVGRRTVEPPDYSKARSRIADILERRALARRRVELVAELDRRYGLRANPAVVATPANLARLLGEAPATVLYRWQGGELDLATFAQGLDLAALAAAPVEAAQAELDGLLRRTVNDALVRAETRRRALAERPDVAAEVARHREALMEQVLYADHVLAGLTVPEAEVRAWYDQHPEDAVSSERRRISQIVTRERAEAEAVAARLAAGEEFARLAREVSIDVMSGKAGGDIGWVDTADMGSEFAAVAALAVGEVAGPIESKFGWHLMRLEAIEAPRPRPYEEVREALSARLLDAAKTARRTEWVRQLRAASEVIVDDAAIERWAAAVEDPGEAPPSHRPGARSK